MIVKRVCFVAAVTVLLAGPTLVRAAEVVWSDFETGTNYGLGDVGENMKAPSGYGPPSFYGLSSSIFTTTAKSQLYTVPGSAFGVDPDGEGWMIPADGGGTFDATDWDDFIMNTLGGPAPIPSATLHFVADVRIDADNAGDYDTLKWFPIHNAPGSTFAEFDPINNAEHDFGVWETDFEFLTTAFDGTGNLSFILILASAFDINNGSAGNVRFYLDNVRLRYASPADPVPPTPTPLAGVGSSWDLYE